MLNRLGACLEVRSRLSVKSAGGTCDAVARWSALRPSRFSRGSLGACFPPASVSDFLADPERGAKKSSGFSWAKVRRWSPDLNRVSTGDPRAVPGFSGRLMAGAHVLSSRGLMVFPVACWGHAADFLEGEELDAMTFNSETGGRRKGRDPPASTDSTFWVKKACSWAKSNSLQKKRRILSWAKAPRTSSSRLSSASPRNSRANRPITASRVSLDFRV